jgi:glycosyltransferase involved in cell wall biosynthesis
MAIFMKLSIVIPVKNEEANLPLLLDSIAQSKKGVVDQAEVIVIDNVSTDRSQEIAEAHLATVLTSPGLVSDARFAGVAKASGDWVLLLDADHVLPICTLGQLATLMHDPQGVKAYTVAERAYEPKTWVGRALSLERQLIEEAGRGIPRFFSRVELLKMMEHQKPRAFGEDYALLLSMAEADVRYAPEIVILHRELETVRQLFQKYRTYARKARADGGFVSSVAKFRLLDFIKVIALAMIQRPVPVVQVIVLRLVKIASVLVELRLNAAPRKEH